MQKVIICQLKTVGTVSSFWFIAVYNFDLYPSLSFTFSVLVFTPETTSSGVKDLRCTLFVFYALQCTWCGIWNDSGKQWMYILNQSKCACMMPKIIPSEWIWHFAAFRPLLREIFWGVWCSLEEIGTIRISRRKMINYAFPNLIWQDCVFEVECW